MKHWIIILNNLNYKSLYIHHQKALLDPGPTLVTNRSEIEHALKSLILPKFQNKKLLIFLADHQVNNVKYFLTASSIDIICST